MAQQGLITVDLGGTRLRVAVVDSASGDELQRHVVRTPTDQPEAFVSTLRSTLTDAGLPIVGAVIGVPGPVSYSDGTTRVLPNLRQWGDALSEAALTGALNIPVALVNDADLAALGEYRFGAGQGTSDMVYLTISTGVGAGVVLRGRLARGTRSIAEAGWMPAGMHRTESIEEIASGSALQRRTGWAGEELLRRAVDGEPPAVEALAEAAEAIGVAVATFATLFAPQRIVIGGGLGLAAFDMLLGPARERLQHLAWLGTPPELHRAALGDDAGLRGAVAFWQMERESASA